MLTSYLLWAGVAVAVVYLPMSGAAPSWPRSAVKTLPLAGFTLAAGISGAPWFLVAALGLSALGDLALSRRGEAAFLAGLTAFAVAHLAFIALFISVSGQPVWHAFAAQLPLALVLAAIALSSELWLAPHTGRLKWPVRVYVGIITLMGLAALTLPPGLLTLGVVAFLTSDILLALQLFRMRERNLLLAPAGWLLWGLYIAGQTMIFVAAAPLPSGLSLFP